MKSANINYKEGDLIIFSLPRGGFAIGVIARTSRDGIILVYFANKKFENIPTLKEIYVSDLEFYFAWRTGDLALLEGKWKVIGEYKGFRRENWPIPLYIRKDPLSKKAWEVKYNDLNISIIESETPTNYKRTDLDAEGVAGYRFVEKKLDHSIEYEEKIQNAKANWKSGNYKETLSNANQALEIAKTAGEKCSAHYWKGIGLYNLGKLDEAQIEEEKAIALDPGFSAPYVTLGAVYLDRKDFAKAEELAHVAIELDPNYAWSYNLLGLTYIYQGKTNEGIWEIEKAAEIAPETFKAQLEWAKSQKQK